MDGSKLRSRLPEGGLGLAAGLVVLGGSSYLVLIVAGRSLGAADFSGVSALYVLVSTISTGLFLSTELEVARAWGHRRELGQETSALIPRSALASAGVTAVFVLVATTVLRGFFLDLLSRHEQLLWALVLGLTGYAACFLSRGAYAGAGRFNRYGTQLALEGGLRLVGAAGLAAAGGTTPAEWGWMICATPWMAFVLTVPWGALHRPSGEPVSWSLLGDAMIKLTFAVAASQVLINAGPLVVQLLAKPGHRAATGGFLAALVIVRMPIFLFTAVQPSFLPALSGHAAAGRRAELRSLAGGVLKAVVAASALFTLLLVAVGGWGIHRLFGFSAGVSHGGFAALGLACGLFLVTTVLAQVLLSLGDHAGAALGWLAGLVGLAAGTALPWSAVERAEAGFLGGALIAVVAHGLRLRARWARIGEPAT